MRLRSHRTARRRGLSMVEAAASTVVVALMMVAALNTAGASRTSLQNIGDRAKGGMLAADLMSEILTQPYEDPAVAGGKGAGVAELATGNRSLFNDVDDYDGWTASPPQHKDGTVPSGYTNWKHSVVVEWVLAADPSQRSLTDTGVKWIEVTVSLRSKTIAVLTAIRTKQTDASYKVRDGK